MPTIHVVSLLLTFKKYTGWGVLSFSIHHFCFNIQSVGVKKSVDHSRKNKLRNERWKENHKRKINYFILKYVTF